MKSANKLRCDEVGASGSIKPQTTVQQREDLCGSLWSTTIGSPVEHGDTLSLCRKQTLQRLHFSKNQ